MELPTMHRHPQTQHRLQVPGGDLKHAVHFEQHAPLSLQALQVQVQDRVFLGSVDALLERERLRLKALQDAGEDTSQPGGPPGTEINITLNMPKKQGNC